MASHPLDRLISQLETHAEQPIRDRLEDTFGPNPCGTLHLTNRDTGETAELTCDRKRCRDCGPRKQFLLWHQLTTIGPYAYIARTNNLTDINTGLERAKKRRQRHGEQFIYTIVGDRTLGWIIISDTPIIADQRYMELGEWRRRILDLYHQAIDRIRRTQQHFGRMSLVTLRRNRAKRDNPSPWYRRTVNSDVVDEMAAVEWSDLLAELTHLHDASLPHPPPDTTPIPY